MQNLSEYILAHALKNSLEFGKTSLEIILPKLFQHGLEKKDIKEILPKIREIVEIVNKLSEKQKQEEFRKYESLLPEKPVQSGELPELPKVSKKPVFRMAPFPSGALHIGNARTLLLNAMYSEKYKGKILLVMDDTIGSSEKPPIKEAYELIKDSAKWLKVKYGKNIIYKSDRLKIYYDYAEQLIKKDKAYVCHCSQEELRNNRAKGIECSCRQFPQKIQLLRWKEMFKMKEGEGVLRIKTDMLHPNPAFRDRVLFKISDREHPRVKKKYRVWPTLEMSWAVDDHLLGVTHVIRGSDLLMETDMEKFIWDIFNWKHPEVIHHGLVNLETSEGKISKSKAGKEVKSGVYTGWDDPRTWSLQSLRRRGILPDSLRQFVKELGMTKQNITVPIESLYAINRKAVDRKANRYSFVSQPVELKIKNAPDITEVQVPIHPDKKETKKVSVEKIFISEDDCQKFKGKEVRLLHLYNIKISSGNEAEFTSKENKEIPKINWVSSHVSAKILLPSGIWQKGIAESSIKNIKKDEVLQLERFAFVKYDKRGKDDYEFWFTHR